MGFVFKIAVVINGYNPTKVQAIKNILQKNWNLESEWPPSYHYIAMVGDIVLPDNNSDNIAMQISHVVWSANEKFCPVEVDTTLIAEMPES